ncbi:MAG: hypothetical protein MHMPM18_001921 [Marteilia pararefringens]
MIHSGFLITAISKRFYQVKNRLFRTCHACYFYRRDSYNDKRLYIECRVHKNHRQVQRMEKQHVTRDYDYFSRRWYLPMAATGGQLAKRRQFIGMAPSHGGVIP